MARTNQFSSPRTTLAIRTRDSLAEKDIITLVTGKFIPNQADRCPFPGCMNHFSHQHSIIEGEIAPSVDHYREAGEAVRRGWTEEQRLRIAENEAGLRQLAEIEPKVGGLSIKTHLPRGNDGTVKEQIDATREMLLELQRQEIVANTSPISPVFPADSSFPHTEYISQSLAEQTSSIEWDDFPELDAKYAHSSASKVSIFEAPDLLRRPSTKLSSQTYTNSGKKTGTVSNTISKPYSLYQNRDSLNANSSLCTGPCPVQTPHNRGPYLQQGQVPRIWNARWGYSDPPREIWEAWVRIEQGRGRTWDQVEVDGFALSHWWAGP